MIIPKDLPKKANRQFTVTTPPIMEPITVDELKLFARIDGTDEDSLLSGFITAARQAAELYLRRALIEQTIKLDMDYWPSLVIELPRPPLISVTSVVLLGEDDTETAYASSNYYVITNSTPGTLVIKQDATPPDNTDRDCGGYRIEYKAGYGSLASDVPIAIKEGIKLWATDIYENRVVRNDPPPEAKSFLDMYRYIRS